MTIQEHEARKPVRTKPVKDMTQAEYTAWSTAMSQWLWMRDAITAMGSVEVMEARPLSMGKACTPAADYEWRDIPKRKSRGTRPGGSREYNRQKQAERRARIRAAVIEVQADRDGRVA